MVTIIVAKGGGRWVEGMEAMVQVRVTLMHLLYMYMGMKIILEGCSVQN